LKQKKRYILLRSESTDIEKISNIKLISNQNGHVIVSCKLIDLSKVVSEIEKKCKIVTVSGTLKSLRSSV
jgi:energy-converting hydrogenase Eha subunit C